MFKIKIYTLIMKNKRITKKSNNNLIFENYKKSKKNKKDKNFVNN